MSTFAAPNPGVRADDPKFWAFVFEDPKFVSSLGLIDDGPPKVEDDVANEEVAAAALTVLEVPNEVAVDDIPNIGVVDELEEVAPNAFGAGTADGCFAPNVVVVDESGIGTPNVAGAGLVDEPNVDFSDAPDDKAPNVDEGVAADDEDVPNANGAGAADDEDPPKVVEAAGVDEGAPKTNDEELAVDEGAPKAFDDGVAVEEGAPNVVDSAAVVAEGLLKVDAADKLGVPKVPLTGATDEDDAPKDTAA